MISTKKGMTPSLRTGENKNNLLPRMYKGMTSQEKGPFLIVTK